MAVQQNMGPFAPVTVKGGAQATAVPVFIDKLPVTLGGIAGPGAFFGRVVSREGHSHQFLQGIPSGANVAGILIYDPTISYTSPAKSNMYFEGQPATVVTYGMIEIQSWDTSYQAPTFGSQIIANNTDGRLAFIAATAAVPSGWTALNAVVYDTMEPNGVKIWLNMPIVAQVFQALQTVATPVANPAAGAIAAGTTVMITSATLGAVIRYTLDGTQPTFQSPIFPAAGLAINNAVTITAVALMEGMNPSAVLTAAYTIA